MPVPMIVLVGNKGSGKNTVAKVISGFHPGTVEVAFADPFKRFLYRGGFFTRETLWGESSGRDDTVCKELPDFDARNRAEVHLTDETGFLVGADTILRRAFAFEDDVPLTARKALQAIGDQGRYKDRNVWARIAVESAVELLGGDHQYKPETGLVVCKGDSPPPLVLLTDGRYANEVMGVKLAGGVAWRIVRPDLQQNDFHSSERIEIPSTFFDRTIVNDGDEKELAKKVALALGRKVAV